MQAFDVLLKPVLSEKSALGKEEYSQYTFIVHNKATKHDISKAVNSMFGVNATKVRTNIRRISPKRRGLVMSKPRLQKRAIVTLAKGEKIKAFDLE